jgi:prolyl-tRNA synthetase
MRQTQLFTKTKREEPRDEVSKNAKLLIKAGFIYKEMAGVYVYLPLGLRVLKKIEQIIREEMNAIGGQEITLTALQQRETWEPTNQWDDKEVDIWFKTKLKNETEVGLGVTHEAPITKMMKDYINSYRDLPKYVYQFQTKFRNEIRAKSGIMRCREFVMKDLYSFSCNEDEHNEFYEKSKQAYINIFNRVGIGDKTYLTFASGGMFSKFSHEFQTITESGEDIIYIDKEKNIALNKEVYNDEVISNLQMDKTKLVEAKSVEVGNIFTLSDRFSNALNLKFKNENGDEKNVLMGSYGIGPGRVMGTVVEVLSDEKGIVWPESIAPYKIHLVLLGNSEIVKNASEEVYSKLLLSNFEVLFDDRLDVSIGEKLNDSDLMGLPFRVVVSEKSISLGGIEVKKRVEKEASVMSIEEFIDQFSI